MSDPGFVQVCTTADTDYPIEIPREATGALLWFELASDDPTLVHGRILYAANNTAVTVDDENMAHSPATPTIWPRRYAPLTYYLHVACSTAGAVCYGTWLTPTR